MAKTAVPRDGVTVVIPAHNAAAALERVLPAWGAVLTNSGRPFEILVVNDGSTDGTAAALEKLAARVPHLQILTNATRAGFGACLRTALAETKYPLFMYAGVDYPYTPTDIRPMLERIDLRDELLGKQPDLISGARAGQPQPFLVKYVGGAWKLFWRVFAGLPVVESPPWYGWGEWWYRLRVGWVYGVPLADVNSAFKLYRTAFLKRFPIQSDGDFVHTELVAKATFLTSIMDEIAITARPDPFPPLGPLAADRAKVFGSPEFAFYEPAKPPEPESAPVAPALAPATAVPNAGTSLALSAESKTGATTTSPEAPPAPKTDVPPAPTNSEPAPKQEAAQPAPAVPAPATSAPAVESPKPTESSAGAAPTEATKPEAAKPAGELPKPATSTPPAAQAEPNAGGLTSPGSPVSAT